jgi:hypothetical protein
LFLFSKLGDERGLGIEIGIYYGWVRGHIEWLCMGRDTDDTLWKEMNRHCFSFIEPYGVCMQEVG